MKAVVWADTAQSAVMLSGVIALLIQGTRLCGGVGNVIEAARETGRLQPWKRVLVCHMFFLKLKKHVKLNRVLNFTFSANFTAIRLQI